MPKLIVLFFLFLLPAGCSSPPVVPAAGFVDLNQLQPLPTPVEQEIQPLRVAIAAVISPQGTAESYAPLLDYLSDKLDRPVERIQRRTYAEVNELLSSGEVDMAFVCTSSYLLGKREFELQLLAAPQVEGEVVYHAQLIVPARSLATSIEDLRGKAFAFTDPTSFTGRVYPTYLLQKLGEQPETYFARIFFTYSHDDAIRAVADGVADGASVDSLVLEFALKRTPELAQQIRIIHTSPPFGMPPVVISPDLRPQTRAELEAILLNMHQDADGLAALQSLDYDKFVQVSPGDYQSAEQIESLVPFAEIEP
jgi:phosphonate transport system substrate-binding protein